MKFRSLGRAVLALGVLPGLATLLISCGGGHTIGYAYVLSSPAGANSIIYTYEVRSDNGALTPSSNFQLSSSLSGGVSTTATPDHLNLYVLFPQGGTQAGAIVHYRISSESGQLTAAETVTTGGSSPARIAVDSVGGYLYAVDTYSLTAGGDGASGPGDVTVFKIGTNGTLGAPSCDGVTGVITSGGAGCSYQVGYAPQGVNATQQSTNGSFVYVTNSGITAPASSATCYNTVSGYTLQSGGALAPITFTPLAGTCIGSTAFPAGSLAVGQQPWAVTSVIASADGNPFVYITDNSQNFVYAFTVSATGTLSSVGGVSGQGGLATGFMPQNAIVDPRARFLYVANYQDNTISAYVITASSGQISAVSGSPFGASGGSGPLCMAIDPSEGKYFYAADFLSGTVSGFQLNGSTGQLSLLSNQPFLLGDSGSGVNTTQPACVSVVANGSTPTPGTP